MLSLKKVVKTPLIPNAFLEQEPSMPHLSTSGLLKVRIGQSPDLVRGNRGGNGQVDAS